MIANGEYVSTRADRTHREMSPFHRTRRSFLVTAASLVSARSLAHAQQPDVTFTAGVKVVTVFATVMNRNGQIIRDLARDDFLLSENGRPQEIRYFSRESGLPLTLGLLVDTSMSQQRVLSAERGACYRFLDRVLRETMDLVFIMQFDRTVQIKQGLTASRQALDEALAYVDTPTRRELRSEGGGTVLYDAVETASKDIMKKQTGRKALIVLSDGVDYGSDVTAQDAVEAAQRAETLVFSVLFSDSADSYGRGVLKRLSKETGGGFFEVSKKLTIERVFDVIQEELRGQYSLGYVSDEPVRVSEFRRIQLTAKQKGLIVQGRERYWAQR